MVSAKSDTRELVCLVSQYWVGVKFILFLVLFGQPSETIGKN